MTWNANEMPMIFQYNPFPSSTSSWDIHNDINQPMVNNDIFIDEYPLPSDCLT